MNEQIAIKIKKENESYPERVIRKVTEYIEIRKIIFNYMKKRINEKNIIILTNDDLKNLSEKLKINEKNITNKIIDFNKEETVIKLLGKEKGKTYYKLNYNNFDEIPLYKKLRLYIFYVLNDPEIQAYKMKGKKLERVHNFEELSKKFEVKKSTISFFEYFTNF